MDVFVYKEKDLKYNKIELVEYKETCKNYYEEEIKYLKEEVIKFLKRIEIDFHKMLYSFLFETGARCMKRKKN